MSENQKTIDELYGELDTKKSGNLPPIIQDVPIVEVHVRKAGELFGDSVKPFEGESLESAKNREMIQVIVASGYEFNVKESFSPSRNPQSKLGKFLSRYNSRPLPGVKVSLVQQRGKDGRNYYRILI